jgi:demethylmenaquinone methyltransferase/2-methoxy-6-polyprenyl-1,4-benzoquinol methylase
LPRAAGNPRLLKPGGAAVILEFSKPAAPVFRTLFDFYFRHVLPKLGALISGHGRAYQYLPDSVSRFPNQEELEIIMRTCGFKDVQYRNLSGGISALHWGRALTTSPRLHSKSYSFTLFRRVL